MDESKIRKIVQDEIRKNANQSRFSMRTVPYHVHNGIDAPFISEDNIVLTNKLTARLTSTESEVFTLRGTSNVSRVSFHGFAYKSDTSPSQKKAIINGEIIFGVCNTFSGAGPTISITSVPPGFPYCETSNYMYIDTTDLSHTTVGDVNLFAYATDESNEVARMTLIGFTDESLTFQTTLSTDWVLDGAVIIE